ncbi:MAG: TetR family transcriptional regulator [Streptosporangiales bacterium]|nr:TetR family transcriptional regulator [Streptosporangiales bacterium]
MQTTTEEGPRTTGRSAATRRALQDAAQEIFARHGYAQASIADIVERSKSSVGSLYHHYGGKSGLFLALWETYQRGQEQRAAAAVAGAKERGVTEPIELFVAGARAFLEGCWENREVARLFLENDGPTGFDLVRRGRGQEWVRQNTKLLRVDDTKPSGHVLVTMLTSVIGEAGREVAACEDETEAEEVIEEVCRILVRLSG